MPENLDTNLPIAYIEGEEIKATPYFEDYLFNLVSGLGGEGTSTNVDDLEKQIREPINYTSVFLGILATAANSSLLEGQNSAYHLSRTNHSGTQLASTISDLVQPVTATTAELVDIGAAINTDAAKELGYMVTNSTTGLTVFASGNTDGAVWHFYDESLAHTPA